MKDTLIIEREKVRLKNGILITGLPGIGLIGQVVGRYMVKELKARKVAKMFSPHFPHQVLMTKKGGMRLIRNTFYVYKGKGAHILFLVGDIQAMSSVGQYEVADKVLDYAKACGVKDVMTIGGYSTGKISDKRRIFAVANKYEDRKKFSKLGVIFGEARGSIVGAAGLLPALGKYKNLGGICIMGETHGGYVDTASARTIVQMLSKFFGIKIDLKRLDARAKESEQVIRKIEEEISRNMEGPEVPKAGVSYIR